tara:strand:+ start:987 stop:1307 length:321 start_codon:yes stop_codon:yes gene_type:complete
MSNPVKATVGKALRSLITISANGQARKVRFKKVPGKGFAVEIPQNTQKPQALESELESVEWGMIFNGKPSLYNGQIQAPSITIGPKACLGTSSSSGDVDELLEFLD